MEEIFNDSAPEVLEVLEEITLICRVVAMMDHQDSKSKLPDKYQIYRGVLYIITSIYFQMLYLHRDKRTENLLPKVF